MNIARSVASGLGMGTVVAVLLAACGQKGPLNLPQKPPTPPTAAAASAAAVSGTR